MWSFPTTKVKLHGEKEAALGCHGEAPWQENSHCWNRGQFSLIFTNSWHTIEQIHTSIQENSVELLLFNSVELEYKENVEVGSD